MCMVTIGQFILARVEEDEFLARHMVAGSVDTRRRGAVACLGSWDPRRVLTSCVARRRLVLDHRVSGAGRTPAPCACGHPETDGPPCSTLRALALEWADHPDFPAEWRPHPVPRQPQSA